MIRARIYRPARSAMQSGRGRTQEWLIEFEPAEREDPDPLMGWPGSHDTLNQVHLHFQTREEAVAFAERNGYSYEVSEERPRRPPKPKSYADNFRFDKVG